MAIDISTANRSAMCDALVDSVDGGTGAGYIEVRTGSKPANCAAASTGTLLATLTMSDPAFGAASSGVATANSITSDTNADATGTPGYFRVFDSDNNCLMQGTAGVGSGDMNFDNSIVATGTVSISSMTVTVPESGA